MNKIELDANLLTLLPPWYQDVLDYQKICQIEEEQLSTLGAEIITVASNMFFQTMDESAISLWEQVLQIVPNPVTEDLAFRQYRVINRLSTHPPYTLGFLYQKLDGLIGPGKWMVEVDYPNYHLTLTTSLQNAIYEGETIYLVNKIKPAHIGWNILYKDTPTSQIYVGTVGRRALVEITQNIQTPKQGLMPAWVGMWERHGSTVISTVICSSFLQNQIYVGIVEQQATIELTNGIQTPKQGLIPTWIGMHERHGGTVISIVDCTPTLKNQIYNSLLTRQADKEVF